MRGCVDSGHLQIMVINGVCGQNVDGSVGGLSYFWRCVYRYLLAIYL